MNINPGELNHKIQIIRIDKSATNENGFPIIQEEVLYTCWAKVSHKTGSAIAADSSDFSKDKTRFLVRYKPGIDTGCIVRYKGNDYNVIYLNDYEENHEYTEIWTEKAEKTRKAV